VIHPDGTPVPPLPDLRFVALDAPALGLEGARMSYMEAGEGPATVLLSPAAASFDMFPDYAARGRAFKDAVADLVAARARSRP